MTEPTCIAERATQRQLTKIVLQLQDLGVKGRDRRLAIVTALTSREVNPRPLGTMHDLTRAQAGLLIEELDHLLRSPDPVGGLAAAAAAAGGFEWAEHETDSDSGLMPGVVLCEGCGHNVLAHKGGRCEGVTVYAPATHGHRPRGIETCPCTGDL